MQLPAQWTWSKCVSVAAGWTLYSSKAVLVLSPTGDRAGALGGQFSCRTAAAAGRSQQRVVSPQRPGRMSVVRTDADTPLSSPVKHHSVRMESQTRHQQDALPAALLRLQGATQVHHLLCRCSQKDGSRLGCWAPRCCSGACAAGSSLPLPLLSRTLQAVPVTGSAQLRNSLVPRNGSAPGLLLLLR
jgi:hypothetical protein